MKKIYFIIVVLIFFLGCKRYEENPFIVPNSFLKRINGNWKIESAMVNSIIVSTDVDTLKTDFYFFSFVSKQTVKKNNLDFEGVITIYFLSSFAVYQTNVTLSNNNKEMLFWSHYPCYNYPICNKPEGNIPVTINNTFDYNINGYYLQETWRLTKLTNKELWLTSDFDGNSYETHFKEMED